MDALEILKQDHQKVKELFHEATRGKDLFDKIDTELEIHGHIEETVFYPALEQHEELKDMVAEALEEHQEVKMLLEELEELGPKSHDFGAKLQGPFTIENEPAIPLNDTDTPRRSRDRPLWTVA